jgi:hypothetical protein
MALPTTLSSQVAVEAVVFLTVAEVLVVIVHHGELALTALAETLVD